MMAAGPGPEPTTMVCRCGKPLSLKGATPGRVGRCPHCGATFRVPAHFTPPPPTRPASEPRPRGLDLDLEPLTPRAPAPLGPGLGASGRDESPIPLDFGPGPSLRGPEPLDPGQLAPGPAAEDEDEWNPTPGGYDLAPVEAPRTRLPGLGEPPAPLRRPAAAPPAGSTLVPSDRAARPDRGETPRVPVEPVGRGGLIPLPKQSETTLLGSLLYPFWDGLGLAWMVTLGPVLAVAALIVFKLIPVTVAGGNMALLGPFAFGFIIVLGFVVAYLLAIWGAVLVATAHGDVHHPGWPELGLGPILATLIRWGLALAPGCGLMAYLARRTVLDGPDPGLAGWLMAAALVGAGGLYSLVALVALYLYDDLIAASPTVVVPGMVRFGLPLLQVVGLFTGALMLGVVVVRAIDRVTDFWPLVLAGWGGSVLLIYLGLVVSRVLGRAYLARAGTLGWFVRRSRDDEDDDDEAENDIDKDRTLPGADH